MESATKLHGSEWPCLDLSTSLKNAKSSKKVFLVERHRAAATLEAVKLAAMLQRGPRSADFSILDFIHSIPQHIQIDLYYLQGSRRQLQHYNRAPAWRYGNPELKAIFYQLAMLHQVEQTDQRQIPFSLNLTPQFTSKALQNPKGFVEHTKRQLDKAFLSELGRKPQYWFAVELVPEFGGYTKGPQRPHLHGCILITQVERNSIRNQKSQISAAFHRAVGKCPPDFSNRLLCLGNHEAHAQQKGISEIEAAINWAGYCLKHNAMARVLLNSKSNLIADNATKSQSEALYGLLNKKLAKPAIVDGIDMAAILEQI